LVAVEEKISGHYSKAKELQAEAYQIRVDYQGDVTKLKQANELDAIAKSHFECAERLRSEERFIATRELDEVLEKTRLIKSDILQYTKVNERYEAEKEQLKQEEYQRKWLQNPENKKNISRAKRNGEKKIKKS
jgi:hypothetical protein